MSHCVFILSKLLLSLLFIFEQDKVSNVPFIQHNTFPSLHVLAYTYTDTHNTLINTDDHVAQNSLADTYQWFSCDSALPLKESLKLRYGIFFFWIYCSRYHQYLFHWSSLTLWQLNACLWFFSKKQTFFL